MLQLLRTVDTKIIWLLRLGRLERLDKIDIIYKSNVDVVKLQLSLHFFLELSLLSEWTYIILLCHVFCFSIFRVLKCWNVPKCRETMNKLTIIIDKYYVV